VSYKAELFITKAVRKSNPTDVNIFFCNWNILVYYVANVKEEMFSTVDVYEDDDGEVDLGNSK
jgi:hypothetical protein